MTAKFVHELAGSTESEDGGLETYDARRGSPRGFHPGQLVFLVQTIRD